VATRLGTLPLLVVEGCGTSFSMPQSSLQAAAWTSPRWPDTRVMRPSWTVTG
jgi:hypothetical protein